MPRYQNIKLDTDTMFVEDENENTSEQEQDAMLNFSEDDEINLSEDDDMIVGITEE